MAVQVQFNQIDGDPAHFPAMVASRGIRLGREFRMSCAPSGVSVLKLDEISFSLYSGDVD